MSPILSPSPPGGDPDQHWTVALQAIFAVLAQHFVLAPTAHAGTHVHVSCEPAGAGLGGSATALAAVAKAALYFEPALDALMPASRSRDAPYWCQSNRASVALRGAAAAAETADDLSACFALLDECCVGGGGGVEKTLHVSYGDVAISVLIVGVFCFLIARACLIKENNGCVTRAF